MVVNDSGLGIGSNPNGAYRPCASAVIRIRRRSFLHVRMIHHRLSQLFADALAAMVRQHTHIGDISEGGIVGNHVAKADGGVVYAGTKAQRTMAASRMSRGVSFAQYERAR
ncbi:MAG: hypothetical protein ACI9TH_004338 [Kiritimatiellia bacterium]|jgi:hypothetical protein